MPAVDQYSQYLANPLGSLTSAFAITPSDTEDLPFVTRQIRVGTAGNMAVIWASGVETIEPVIAGETLDWRIVRVKLTGTTAANMRGYF